MVTRICQYCGVEYETSPSQRPKYCSFECSNKGRRTGEIVKCVQCGKDFYRHKCNSARRYCSKSCAITARNLTDANPSYHRDITGSNNPMYGVSRFGPDNPMYGKRKEKCTHWKGGEKTRKDGYVLVVAPDDHPYPCDTHKTGLKYILKHRLVMEQHLGRYLTPTEVVHHIDGNPQNNNIENLRLFSSQAEHIRVGHG